MFGEDAFAIRQLLVAQYSDDPLYEAKALVLVRDELRSDLQARMGKGEDEQILNARKLHRLDLEGDDELQHCIEQVRRRRARGLLSP